MKVYMVFGRNKKMGFCLETLYVKSDCIMNALNFARTINSGYYMVKACSKEEAEAFSNKIIEEK